MAKAVVTLADEVQAKSGIIKPDATKIASTLVSSYGATCWEDVKDIAAEEFDEAIKEAKLLPISIKKLVAVNYTLTLYRNDSFNLHASTLIFAHLIGQGSACRLRRR